jgi:tRNA pseudouridine55 synthase
MSVSGVLLIDKSAEMSSAKVVTKLRKKFKSIEKIGHAGTLDPFATGLLIILLGRATRLADYFQAGHKAYSGEILLGVSTDTDDVTGDKIAESETVPEIKLIQEAALAMQGVIEQFPPRFSAKWVDGKRAYALARKGRDFDLAPRSVTLSKVSISEGPSGEILFAMNCSKGFYVRAFARDLGQILGCGACLKTLRREASVPFNLSMAKTLDNVDLSDVIPWDEAMKRLAKPEECIEDVEVEDGEFDALKRGLVPYSLCKRALHDLDSSTNALLVYRRQSDGIAGGLLSRKGSDLTIALNM